MHVDHLHREIFHAECWEFRLLCDKMWYFSRSKLMHKVYWVMDRTQTVSYVHGVVSQSHLTKFIVRLTCSSITSHLSMSNQIQTVLSQLLVCFEWCLQAVTRNAVILMFSQADSDQSVHPPSIARVLVLPALDSPEVIKGTCDQQRLIRLRECAGWSESLQVARLIVCFVLCWLIYHYWDTTWQNQQSNCAPSESSDQSGHPPNLISVFHVRSMDS